MRKNSKVGGQAVLEGVMMRSPNAMAIAVRQEDGTIALQSEKLATGEKPWYERVPLVRGVTNFLHMMVWGVKCLNQSAQMAGMEEEEPGKFEQWLTKVTGKNAADVAIGVGMVLGLALAVGLFFVLPQVLGSLLIRWIPNKVWLSLVEGVIRLVIFFAYLLLVGSMKEIRRFFAYHGAEHKTINAYEDGQVLTPETVMRYSTRHPRCGTSFLLIVMTISILVFAVAGFGSTWYMRVLSRLVLLPVVAGISYEVLMLLARWENGFTAALRKPGMALQALTTREPDAQMCEVAITAFLACLDEEERAVCAPPKKEEENTDDHQAGTERGPQEAEGEPAAL
ncbi:MAG: DUF1385 domain-containing protein [Eubacteriales bacterium]|nr:DUF1385 domain-containing protein [Eubacteriales bacterium]